MLSLESIRWAVTEVFFNTIITGLRPDFQGEPKGVPFILTPLARPLCLSSTLL